VAKRQVRTPDRRGVGDAPRRLNITPPPQRTGSRPSRGRGAARGAAGSEASKAAERGHGARRRRILHWPVMAVGLLLLGCVAWLSIGRLGWQPAGRAGCQALPAAGGAAGEEQRLREEAERSPHVAAARQELGRYYLDHGQPFE